jgi:ABC-type Na+ transport system ATPase subunit NatA
MEKQSHITVKGAVCSISLLTLTLLGNASLSYAQPPASTQPPTAPAANQPAQPPVDPKTKRVMIIAFQQLERNIKNNLPIGQDVADMMTIALVNQGARVVERIEMAQLEKERGFTNGTGDQAAIQALGKLKGANVAVMGKILEFGVFEKNATQAEKVKSGLGNVLGGSIKIGGNKGKKPLEDNKEKKYELRVKMQVRLVSIDSGDILAAEETTITEAQSENSIEALFGKNFAKKNTILGVAGSLLDQKSSDATTTKADDWNESKAGMVAKKAVGQLATTIFNKIPLAPEGEVDDAVSIKVIVDGLADYSAADSLAKSIEKLKSISEVEIEDFTDGKAQIIVKGSPKAIKGLAAALVSDPVAKSLGLKVTKTTKTEINLKK